MEKRKERKPSMRRRLILALGSIAAILLLSSVISIVEYKRMGSYVSEKVATNINCLNQSQKLAEMVNEKNLQMLAAVMRDDISLIPDFDLERFSAQCDTLRSSLVSPRAVPATDSVLTSFEAFIGASLNFEYIFQSDTVDTRTWFFGELQPKYTKLRADLLNLNGVIHDELRSNSENFDASFYRGIMPGVVSVGAGLLLILLLMYFITVLYVNPLYRISDALDNYRSGGRRYSVIFEGDDQIANINSGVTELAEENMELKRRISTLRHAAQANRKDAKTENEEEE